MENILNKQDLSGLVKKVCRILDRFGDDASCVIEKNTLWLTICQEHSLMLINAILCDDEEDILDVRVSSPEENTTVYVFQFKKN